MKLDCLYNTDSLNNSLDFRFQKENMGKNYKTERK